MIRLIFMEINRIEILDNTFYHQIFRKMQFKIMTFVMIIFMGIAGACNFFETEIKSVSVKEAQELLNNDESIIVVDVRTPAEYRSGFIGTARNFDISASDFEEKIQTLKKSDKIMVVCASGERSRNAANYLKEKGYRNIYEISGGMNEWKAKGMRVTLSQLTE